MASIWRKLTGGNQQTSSNGSKKSWNIPSDDCIDKFDLLSRSYDGGHKKNDTLKRVGSLQDRNRISLPQQQPIQNFKRINSLPPSRLISTNKKNNNFGFDDPGTIQELPLKFDMIRHNLGQTDCGNELAPKLSDLETTVLLLNEKLNQFDHLRRDCIRKMLELKSELQQQQPERLSGPQPPMMMMMSRNSRQRKQEKAYQTRLKSVENFIQRLESLIQENREPLIAPVPIGLEQSSTTEPLSSNEKRAQIQQCYDYMLKSVMPKLYGKSNDPDHDDDHDQTDEYKKSRIILLELRNRVMSIGTQPEQQLIDAKRAFLQEIDSYIRTLDQNDLNLEINDNNNNNDSAIKKNINSYMI